MVGCADFETTTEVDDCRVWAFSLCEIGNYDNFAVGNNIDDFMEICADKKENHTFYFHNLKFDGEFIFYWLGRNGFELVENRKHLVDGSYCTLISDMGQFYSIEVCFTKKGHKSNKVKFMDSMKILNFSVDRIAKDFNLPIKKLELEGGLDREGNEVDGYKKYRKVGHVISQEEYEYIRNDSEIVARALDYMFNLNMDKMTIGADALNDYKLMMGNKKWFETTYPTPSIELDAYLRKSYKGGFTYCDERFKNQIIGEGLVVDSNSLYPSRMEKCLLPFGDPVYYKNEYKKDKLYPLYVQQIECQFEIKEDHIPSIQLKKTMSFIETEYLKSSDGEIVTMYLTSVDLELFLMQYDVFNLNYIDGYKFKGSTKLFKDYVQKWTKEKIQSKKDGNKAMYAIAKLMQNGLYGKFGLSPMVRSKFPVYDPKSDKVSYIMGEWEERKPLYIAMASFITSYARHETITSAQAVYPRFMYADTDSLHLKGLEVPTNLEIDDYKLGAWKIEFLFSKAKYLRQKSYMETGVEPGESCAEYTKVTCAGMPSRCHKNVTYENFKVGGEFKGKLQRTRVKGGIILKDIAFSIK